MRSVEISNQGQVRVVTINRPDRRNAVDAATAHALSTAFRDFDADGSASVAVLTGAGGHFCAGADLQALASGDQRELEPDGDGPMGPTRMRLSKPVIAAVEGYAVAGGLELALWCDLRVAAKDAVFGVFCRRFGVPLIDLGTVRLPRLVGHSRAMDLILTGRGVGAEEALSFGLANRVAPSGEALAAAIALAEELAALPQTCLRNDRASALEQWGMSEGEATINEFRHGMQTISSGETLAGAEAFRSGRGRHGSAR
ncbi:MAG TPA: crotonase/enoyl-CoA hydratase family protein [Candidatus Dormibacteraeota bacterium]|nr:crotonase/enoyl-CoA hydratase family protein [Candidatus Dormibacteraeota bacterium]